MPIIFHVLVRWDQEAEVFYVATTDVPGLSAEAASMDGMLEVLRDLVPELLEANGVIELDDAMPEIPYSVMLDQVVGGHRTC